MTAGSRLPSASDLDPDTLAAAIDAPCHHIHAVPARAMRENNIASEAANAPLRRGFSRCSSASPSSGS
mgnify:CR=1 FL=1